MKQRIFSFYILTSLFLMTFAAEAIEVSLISNSNNGKVSFAVGDISQALSLRGHAVTEFPLSQLTEANGGIQIILATLGDSAVVTALQAAGKTTPSGLNEEGYSILLSSEQNNTKYWIIGADAKGAMYGGLEIAEIITLDGVTAITEKKQNPHLEKRGIKLNIPLDARTPSYADAGSAAQNNILEMWNWDFWTNHLDNLARHRYNAITLWSLHHFPSLVKVPEYPNVALDDVKRSTIDFKAWHSSYHNSGSNMYNSTIASSLETLKVMTIDEKITFWRNVMEYAKDRGIDFYLITWNVFLSSAQDAGYGITNSQNNSISKDYLRKSVKAAFETYPLLKGVGVTTGENMSGSSDAKETWLWETYGAGLTDAQKNDTTNRKFEFIHRHWWSNMTDIKEKFSFNENVDFNFSYKYAKARLFSSTSPSFLNDAGLLNELPEGSRFWLNLRNDDILNFRWGDAAYVREFINNMPSNDKITGFHMGSDGYVWGREFTSTEPDFPRQLELEKHWYNFMLWGRLGYDPEIPDARFQKLIQAKFPEVSGSDIMDLWARASKIIPIVNLSHWRDWDFQWSVEYCRDRYGYHTSFDKDEESAAELMKHTTYVLDKLKRFRSAGGKELRLTLGDIEAMAHLGNYYAQMMLGNKLAAVGHWRKYAAVASHQYTPQLLGRAGWGDWKEFYGRINTKGSPNLPATGGGTILEAEEAKLSNAQIDSTIQGATGSGYVTSETENSSIEWTYNAPKAGEYTIEFRYVLANGEQELPLSVNGQSAGTANFWETGGASSWAWDRKVVNLKSGSNTIKVDVTGIAVSIDHLNVLGGKLNPGINITSPTDGSSFLNPVDTTFSVTVVAGEYEIDRVEFRSNSILLGTDLDASYSFDLDSLPTGINTIEAHVFDKQGGHDYDFINIEIYEPRAINTISWVEDFSLSNGTISDNGVTAWVASRSGGNLQIKNKALEVNDAGDEGVLTTNPIDISGKTVKVSLDLKSVGGLEANQDYVKLFKKVDGGAEVLIGEKWGRQAETSILSNEITGNILELIIRIYVSFSDEYYIIDNLIVKDANDFTSANQKELLTKNVIIYPYPLDNKLLTVTSNNPIDKVLAPDPNGKLMCQEQDIFNTSIELNLANWNKGLYIIQIESEKTKTVETLIFR